MKLLRRRRACQVVMNGTRRPAGIWRIAGMGPFEWVLSHRPFLRMMDVETFRSIYTPKRRRARRKVIPGLDHPWRKFRDHPREDFPF